MKAKSAAIGAAVGVVLLIALAQLNLFSDVPNSGGGSLAFTVELYAFAGFVGALLGAGVGLAIGVGLDEPRPALRRARLQGRRREALASWPRAPERGLSVLDGVASSLHALTLTAVGVTALALLLDGPSRLIAFVMEVSPVGSLGPGWAMLSVLGSVAAIALAPTLALASTRPPSLRIDGAQRKLVAGAGFLSGLVWPGLILAALSSF